MNLCRYTLKYFYLITEMVELGSDHGLRAKRALSQLSWPRNVDSTLQICGDLVNLMDLNRDSPYRGALTT